MNFFVDHEVDDTAPAYLELSSPVNTLAVGNNTLSGFVSEASAVPTITLAVEQAGETTLTTCVDESADEEEWTCQITIGEAQDGDEVKIRLRATDVHGQTSDWVDWHTLTIDSSPPSISLDLDSQTALSDGYLGPNETILSGVITDNRLVGGVELCQNTPLLRGAGGARRSRIGMLPCEQLEVIIDDDTLSQTLYSYSDQPATPITIDAGAACEAGTAIERTFTVTDSFTIAYVDVGLNLAHTYRNDLKIDLYSPAGTQVRLMAFASTAENLDVLFGDAGSSLIDNDLTAHDIRAPVYEEERAPYEFLTGYGGDTVITVTNSITPTMIQLFNIGTVSTTQPFRLDLYFDPIDVPTTTIKWDDLSEYGGYWLVDQAIAPNQAITLTLDSLADGNLPTVATSFDGLTHYYIQLDTLDQVSETHEVARTVNNNIVRGSSLGMEEEAHKSD